MVSRPGRRFGDAARNALAGLEALRGRARRVRKNERNRQDQGYSVVGTSKSSSLRAEPLVPILALVIALEQLMEGFAKRPALVRLLAVVEIGSGLWLALRQFGKE
jgi:hypothetical protein